jgi:hypothetical protein
VQPLFSLIAISALLVHSLLGCCAHHAHARTPDGPVERSILADCASDHVAGSPREMSDSAAGTLAATAACSVHSQPSSCAPRCAAENCYSILAAKAAIDAPAVWSSTAFSAEAAKYSPGRLGVLYWAAFTPSLRPHLVYCVLLV